MMLASLFKFKQHKDNPTQVPIGTPFTMLLIGTLLIALPLLLTALTETFFDSTQEKLVKPGAVTGFAFLENLSDTLIAIADFIQNFARIAGVALVFGGLFKLKQHKDNPTQVPIGTPLTIMLLGS